MFGPKKEIQLAIKNNSNNGLITILKTVITNDNYKYASNNSLDNNNNRTLPKQGIRLLARFELRDNKTRCNLLIS